MPKISVVMSVFNGEKFLKAAVESILSQTYTDFEFIIIDDGSTDSTSEIMQTYHDERIILYRQRNKGVASGLNTGIKMSKGEYIALMGADDISELDRLQHQVEYLDNHHECILIGVYAILIDEDDVPLCKRPRPQGKNAIFTSLQKGSSPFNDGSVMFRRLEGLSCGLFNEQMIVGEDWYFWVKMFQRGEMVNIPLYLYRYRLNSSALTNMTSSMNRQMSSLFKRMLKSGDLEPGAFSKLIEFKKKVKPKELKSLYYLRAGKALLEGEWRVKEAKRYFIKSLQLSPLNFTSWVNYGFCFLPRELVLAWKRYRMSVNEKIYN